MIKGITLDLGGQPYVVPPLSLGSLEVLQERLEAYKGQFDRDSVALVIDCLLAALSRNYPDMTRERVKEMVGLENAIDVMNAITDTSGMRRKAIDAEGSPPGEATPP